MSADIGQTLKTLPRLGYFYFLGDRYLHRH